MWRSAVAPKNVAAAHRPFHGAARRSRRSRRCRGGGRRCRSGSNPPSARSPPPSRRGASTTSALYSIPAGEFSDPLVDIMWIIGNTSTGLDQPFRRRGIRSGVEDVAGLPVVTTFICSAFGVAAQRRALCIAGSLPNRAAQSPDMPAAERPDATPGSAIDHVLRRGVPSPPPRPPRERIRHSDDCWGESRSASLSGRRVGNAAAGRTGSAWRGDVHPRCRIRGSTRSAALPADSPEGSIRVGVGTVRASRSGPCVRDPRCTAGTRQPRWRRCWDRL